MKQLVDNKRQLERNTRSLSWTCILDKRNDRTNCEVLSFSCPHIRMKYKTSHAAHRCQSVGALNPSTYNAVYVDMCV